MTDTKKEFFTIWEDICNKLNESDDAVHAYSLPFYLQQKVDEFKHFKFSNYQGNLIMFTVDLQSLSNILNQQDTPSQEQFKEKRIKFIQECWKLIGIAQNDDVTVTKV